MGSDLTPDRDAPLSQRARLFAVFVLLCCGANLGEIETRVIAFIAHMDGPHTALFGVVFWIWVPAAIAVAACGIIGAERLLATRSPDNPWLRVFVMMGLLAIKIDKVQLGFAPARITLDVGGGGVLLGLNFLALPVIWWWARERSLLAQDVVRDVAVATQPT